ncbi:MAG: hypothetical protein JO157_00780 [Acetobacteraceae bacterium]|nr:hypothetical protein [Acetobacteraceae bacterium]
MSSALSLPSTMPFPTEAVEACLRAAIATAAADQATIRAADGAEDFVGSAEWEPEVDSIVALDVLTALGGQVGIELPDDVVPAGGYADAEACVEHLLRTACAAWTEEHGEAVA